MLKNHALTTEITPESATVRLDFYPRCRSMPTEPPSDDDLAAAVAMIKAVWGVEQLQCSVSGCTVTYTPVRSASIA